MRRPLFLSSTVALLSCSAAPPPVAPPVPAEVATAASTVLAVAPGPPPKADSAEPPSPFHAVTTITLPPEDGNGRLTTELYKLGSQLFVGTLNGGRVRLFPFATG